MTGEFPSSEGRVHGQPEAAVGPYHNPGIRAVLGKKGILAGNLSYPEQGEKKSGEINQVEQPVVQTVHTGGYMGHPREEQPVIVQPDWMGGRQIDRVVVKEEYL